LLPYKLAPAGDKELPVVSAEELIDISAYKIIANRYLYFNG